MAEEMDKEEQATPHKLEEARKKGQVGRSPELVSLALLLALLGGVLALMPTLADTIAGYTSVWIENASLLGRDWSTLSQQAKQGSSSLLRYLGPLYLFAIAAVIIVSIVHAGVVFSTHPLKPDIQRINPAKNIKKLFSLKALVELFKVLVKLGLFIGVSFIFFQDYLIQISQSQWSGPKQIAGLWLDSTVGLICWLLAVFVLSALFDLWHNKRDFAKQMRMSRRDIKDEHRNREGDQEIKAKRKRTQLQIMKRVSGMRKIKEADVVITNPTHVAVALQYRPKTMALPIVITSGKGFFAKLIMLTARKNKILVLRSPPLARALFKDVQPGAPIAADHHNAVAKVYRWVVSVPGNKVLHS